MPSSLARCLLRELGFSQNERMAETNSGCVGSLTRGYWSGGAIAIANTPAIAEPELLHGYSAAESAVRVKNTSDISAILTFGSVPHNSDDMTDNGNALRAIMVQGG